MNATKRRLRFGGALALVLAMVAFGTAALNEALGKTPRGPQGQVDFWNYDPRTGKKTSNASPGIRPRELAKLHGVPALHEHAHHGNMQATPSQSLAGRLALARLATAKYATDLARAKRDGYTVVVTRHIRDMGWHFMNPAYTKFDVRKPSILVYVKRGAQWQLVAFEWVFPEKPAKKPLPGAAYGSFGAACHYADGTFLFAAAETDCAEKSPESGAAFGFWHPDLVTLHVWLWYPNPDGIFAGTNPLMTPFNEG